MDRICLNATKIYKNSLYNMAIKENDTFDKKHRIRNLKRDRKMEA